MTPLLCISETVASEGLGGIKEPDEGTIDLYQSPRTPCRGQQRQEGSAGCLCDNIQIPKPLALIEETHAHNTIQLERNLPSDARLHRTLPVEVIRGTRSPQL